MALVHHIALIHNRSADLDVPHLRRSIIWQAPPGDGQAAEGDLSAGRLSIS